MSILLVDQELHFQHGSIIPIGLNPDSCSLTFSLKLVIIKLMI